MMSLARSRPALAFVMGVTLFGTYYLSYPMQDSLITSRNTKTLTFENPSSSSTSRERSLKPGGQCREETSLYFLKVHKAGSTCIQNLFWRFAVTRSLSVTLFERRKPFPRRDFLPELLPDPTIETFDGRYDVFCEHSFFNELQLKQSMKKDTVYIGILREPLARLRSILNFFGYSRHHNIDVEKEDVAEERLMSTNKTDPKHVSKLLGYNNNTDPHEFVNQIDSKFKVMAILEKLDESLVLMKRKLCWHLKDILYFPMRQKNYTSTDETEKEKDLKARLRQRNEMDYLLYEHFLNRHNSEVAQEGDDFQGEVKWFMKLSDDTTAFCTGICQRMGENVATGHATRATLLEFLRAVVKFPDSPWDAGFSVSGLDCIMMKLNPGVWRPAQKVTQYPEICTSPRSSKVKLKPKHSAFCNEHFAYNFPWEILYWPEKYKTFVAPCY